MPSGAGVWPGSDVSSGDVGCQGRVTADRRPQAQLRLIVYWVGQTANARLDGVSLCLSPALVMRTCGLELVIWPGLWLLGGIFSVILHKIPAALGHRVGQRRDLQSTGIWAPSWHS